MAQVSGRYPKSYVYKTNIGKTESKRELDEVPTPPVHLDMSGLRTGQVNPLPGLASASLYTRGVRHYLMFAIVIFQPVLLDSSSALHIEGTRSGFVPTRCTAY